MSIQENLDAAQAAADVANANLLAAQQAYSAAQPHLSVLAEIEAEAAKLTSDAAAAITDLIT
jgi:hypothetical protein